MAGLSRAAMERLLKQGGAKRVGEDAKDALSELLEEHAREIAARAAALAKHAGRRTVMAADVRMAKK